MNDKDISEYLKLIDELQKKKNGNSKYLDIIKQTLIKEKELDETDLDFLAKLDIRLKERHERSRLYDIKSDFQIDVSPSTWLKPFSNNSIKHILKMAVFYHALALVFMYLVITTFFVYDPNLEMPFYPVTLVDLVTAGPIEESLLFGIPYYVTGNQYVMLGTGIFWTLTHLGGFDEDLNFSEELITWESFAFIIPTLFFSYRTWLSGKGWLSILLHSLWNAGVFGLDCIEFGDCTVYDSSSEGISITWVLVIGSGILLGITYWTYTRRKKKIAKQSETV